MTATPREPAAARPALEKDADPMPRPSVLSRAPLRAAAALGLALAAPAGPAAAQQGPGRACAARALVVERLAERYGETLVSMGMHANAGLLEVYASEATGTWTILVTSPDGLACLIAAGEMWEGQAAPLSKPGKDA
jgi:hypothetical protein